MVNPSIGLAMFVRVTSSVKVLRVTLRKSEAINRDSIGSPGADGTGIMSSRDALSNDISGINPSWLALSHQPRSPTLTAPACKPGSMIKGLGIYGTDSLAGSRRGV
jgi:hypothetical protein